ncbi:transposable element Tcb2 transposase [Trichonephila clavipes]|nr:transposable element Tcb2 transposase [Trichonephila clavipes]
MCCEKVLGPVDPRDVIYTKTRFRKPSKYQSLRRPATSDETRFNLSSDDNRVHVWRPHCERLNPAFALQRHTAPTAGVMVWDAIAYNTRSPLVLIHRTMTAQRYVQDILQAHDLSLMQRLPGAIFLQDNARPPTARVSQDCLQTVTTLPWLFPIPIFVSNRAYLGSFGTERWASYEFERTRTVFHKL